MSLLRRVAAKQVLIAAALVCAGSARGDLAWDTLLVRPVVAAGDDTATGVFYFTNSSAGPVTILDVRTDCECVTAQSDKSNYAAGERGAIRATFRVGASAGVQRKAVFVTTSDAPAEPTLLRLVVTIPALARIEPQVLLWDEANPEAPKHFSLSIDAEISARVISISTGSPFVTTELRTPGPRRYEIVPRIKPEAPAGSVEVVVTIDVNGKVVRRRATLIVR